MSEHRQAAGIAGGHVGKVTRGESKGQHKRREVLPGPQGIIGHDGGQPEESTSRLAILQALSASMRLPPAPSRVLQCARVEIALGADSVPVVARLMYRHKLAFTQIIVVNDSQAQRPHEKRTIGVLRIHTQAMCCRTNNARPMFEPTLVFTSS